MQVRRARPWLGTLVELRVDAPDEGSALAATEAAFKEIATVHRLMSFHADDSDLARLNRHAARAPVAVDVRMREVIELALRFAQESHGRFDPTVARELVEWGLLPHPAQATRPDAGADWRDVRVCDDGRIGYARPLWLDLGGIAKGYAVDRAIDILRARGITQACVNAGGDLRRIGSGVECIDLRHPGAPQCAVPAMELGEGSVASSGAYFARRRRDGRWIGPHVHGSERRAVGTASAVSVVAKRCVVADALTKIVLADPRAARAMLARHAASACVYTPQRGWRVLGQAA